MDVASGRGRHSLLAAELGASVTGIDEDTDRLKKAEKIAQQRNLQVRWIKADLGSYQFPEEEFDVVMVFNYLDRDRMEAMKASVKPGGWFLAETFLEGQRMHGWGPTSDNHLLKSGELLELVRPFEVVLAREVVEIVGNHPASIASVLARKSD